VKVLSLFDGMSCGQIALNKLGIKDYTYYASEIDKYAMQITQKNFPRTIQVGDVTKLKSEDFTNIDLMFAGSPCQGFSFAGKQLAFDDPRSKLFFEFVRLLKEVKPKYFLLENVRMKKEYLDVISEQVGVQPTLINSSLLSAQSRQRYYWTNIPFDKNIEDKGIVLRDILEGGFSTERNKSHCLDANYYKGSSVENYKKKSRRQMVFESPQSYREVRTEEAKQIRKMTRQKTGKDHTPYRSKRLEPRTDGKVGTVTPSLNNDHKISFITKQSVDKYVPNKEADFCDPYNKKTLKGDKSTALRTNSSNGNMWVNHSKIRDKSKTVRSSGRGSYDRHEWDSVDELHWRKLTPLECERLQTVPDNYTEGVSNTQRYKMLGNGWTVDVIAHILKSLRKSWTSLL